QRLQRSKREFQSTLPHGERRNILGQYKISKPVSIHAPARGATVTIIEYYEERFKNDNSAKQVEVVP
ncbi:MAG: hypothetical protein PHX86_07865, partial [Caldisericia bacterium]|nr:hypothetical protein [Caldisericia bacterium]